MQLQVCPAPWSALRACLHAACSSVMKVLVKCECHIDSELLFLSCQSHSQPHCVQVPDKSNLEYQAGQEDGGEDEQPGSEEQQQPGKESAPPDAAQPEGDQALEEEGPVNEDSGDRVEDRHFVPPTAPEQVGTCL